MQDVKPLPAKSDNIDNVNINKQIHTVFKTSLRQLCEKKIETARHTLL